MECMAADANATNAGHVDGYASDNVNWHGILQHGFTSIQPNDVDEHVQHDAFSANV